MRTFIKDDQLFDVRESQITVDEKSELLESANEVLSVLAEEDEGYSDALSEVDRVNSIRSVGVSGMIQLTDEQVGLQNTGLYEFVDGEQVLKDTSKTDEEIEALRDSAYSNVVTGSDKFFIEAYRKEKSGDTEGAASAQALGEARVAEIKAEYPFNE